MLYQLLYQLLCQQHPRALTTRACRCRCTSAATKRTLPRCAKGHFGAVGWAAGCSAAGGGHGQHAASQPPSPALWGCGVRLRHSCPAPSDCNAFAPILQVAFEAAKAAQRSGIDVLLVDTAGRMQVGWRAGRALHACQGVLSRLA